MYKVLDRWRVGQAEQQAARVVAKIRPRDRARWGDDVVRVVDLDLIFAE